MNTVMTRAIMDTRPFSTFEHRRKMEKEVAEKIKAWEKERAREREGKREREREWERERGREGGLMPGYAVVQSCVMQSN